MEEESRTWGNEDLDHFDVEDDKSQNHELNMYKKAIIDFQKLFMGEMDFANAKKKEFQKLVKEPLIVETNIRIKTSTGLYEANFSVNDKLKTLFELVAHEFKITPDKFCFSFSMNRYFYTKTQMFKTFKELNLVPNGLMEMNMNAE